MRSLVGTPVVSGRPLPAPDAAGGGGGASPGLRRCLLLYVALGFVSVFAASLIRVPESRAMLSTVTGILEPAVLLYLTYLCCWWGGETLRTVRGLVLGGAGCVVLWVLLYRLGAGATEYALGADDAGMVRSVLGSMTFGNLTHFALAALVAFPLAFLKEVHRGRLAGIRRYGILGLLAGAVFLGSSRAGLLALALEVLLLIRLRLVPRKMLAFLLILMAASVVVFRETLLLRWEDVAEGYSGRLTPGDLSRVEGWKVALQSIAVYPFGIGGETSISRGSGGAPTSTCSAACSPTSGGPTTSGFPWPPSTACPSCSRSWVSWPSSREPRGGWPGGLAIRSRGGWPGCFSWPSSAFSPWAPSAMRSSAISRRA